MTRAVLLWFRQDLRLTDNPALQAALARGGPVIPVFIHAPDEEAEWAPGGTRVLSHVFRACGAFGLPVQQPGEQ